MSGVWEKTKSSDLDSVGGGILIGEELKISRMEVWNAWQKFSRGKLHQRAVLDFWHRADEEVMQVYQELNDGTYRHGSYAHFVVRDTKRRDIYVANVRDRVVHQLIANRIEPIYFNHFYAHSCAAQRGKGVSAAREYLFDSIVELQNHGRVWFVKLDVRHYFASINQEILLKLLARRVREEKLFALCRNVIQSFGTDGRGLPLGNLTSQWFANVYLHELDWHAKHLLGIRFYMRYNDDVLIVSRDETLVRKYVKEIQCFVTEELCLSIPDEKTSVGCLPETLDVLGMCTNGERKWIRLKTIERARKRIKEKRDACDERLLETFSSYHGMSLQINTDVSPLI